MRKAAILVVVSGLLSGCGTKIRSYETLAPANALSCTLRTATGLGYRPTGGGVSDGYLSFERDASFSAQDIAKEAGARAATLGLYGANRTILDRLTITSVGQTLRLQSTGIDRGGKAAKASNHVSGHVQQIIATCGGSGAPTNAPQQ